MEDYAPTFHCVKGTLNVGADCLSRLSTAASAASELPLGPKTQTMDEAHAIVNEVFEEAPFRKLRF